MKPILLLCFTAAAVFTAQPSSAFQTTTTTTRLPNIKAAHGTSKRITSSTSSSTARSLFFNNQATQQKTPIETEEEKQKRLKLERLAEIEAGEIRRQQRVSEDKLGYLFLFALQFLPLIGNDRYLSIAYFFGLAVTTVYLGGRQEVIDAPEKVTKQNALYAPVGASLAIGGLYLLLKNGLDPTSLYAVGVTVFGALCISDIGVPLLRNLFPSVDFGTAEIELPEGIAKKLDVDRLPIDGLITLGLGLLCTVVYWAPVALENKFIMSNFIAWSLGMVSLGAISLGSFQTGAILLAGLFCYDVFWVFGTDVMMTVATKVEAPVKFLYTAPPSDTPKDYPFSVLGLGDVVIPGLFVRFMAKVDEVLQPKNLSYFTTATFAYGAGLAACFSANEIFHNGQPALLYLDPSLVGSALACAAVNNQVSDVWDFEESGEEKTEEA
mmetsp:Transcript_27535/g.43327  ORF Transcript_27535/g.43327 Transcript_27535/m.43327 type:complete len:437 (-) Transcript_27535:212-1522(-)